MIKRDNILFEWDGKPIPHCTKEEQEETDEYDKSHTDHPEFYPNWDEDEDEDEDDEEHS